MFAAVKVARSDVTTSIKRLLSGMIRCGVCRGSVVIVANGRWGCANTRSTGTCTNRRQISDTVLERKVLGGLAEHLLHPDEVAAAVKHYHRRRSELERRDRQLACVQCKAENTIILHPSMVDSCCEAVTNITAILAHDSAAEGTGRNILRSLIDYIVLTPSPGRSGLEVEMLGRLQNIMALAEGEPPPGGN